ncbi:MAG: cobalamin biosynthesis protein CbiG [Candidatus Melainabacteria bacterium]|nr:MAG: cobalamin biosynthesis protein CbiG [Candidatus Melainabacteria bacterium]
MARRLGIWLVRPAAQTIGQRLCTSFGGTIHKPWQDEVESQKEAFAKVYRDYSAWILVMATGIAVRFLEGLTSDKRSDPAVVVIDEGGNHAIALLGGHEGGANQLAFEVANTLGAVPVVTTATESVKPLILGIGCRKGSSAEDIEAAVRSVLGKRELNEVRELATIDLKSSEPGLLEFCAKYSLPLRWFAQEQVAQRSWVTTPSEFVRSVTGADGVCEPCALMVSPRGRLIVPKTAVNGVTVAIVEDSLIE